ncbi:MAG: hypothetical protein KAG94_01120 [Clostridiales bacterium]|nr:hypothetical protein [Clostridiales bacterium]
MSDERKKILEMLENGKIKADEALELLNAIGEDEVIVEPAKNKPGKAKFLRVRIDAAEKDGKDRAKVNVNIPLSVAKKVTSLKGLIPKSAKKEMEKEGFSIDDIDLQELIEAFENGDMDENLVDIEAGDGDDRVVVKVYVD